MMQNDTPPRPSARQTAPANRDLASAALMARVGRRVRALRNERNMPRRALSGLSGVSQRYLAKLEAGDGNISITILSKVAHALDIPIEGLLAQNDTNPTDLKQVMALYLSADPTTRTRVIQVLDPERAQAQKAKRLCLVGLRGAGKSTLGARVAAQWDAPFVELNAEIERAAGMPVGEIIAMYGQEGYRQLEADTLEDAIQRCERVVLAVAGGIVSNPTTFQTVLARFHTVWLKTSSGEHMDRVRAQGDNRPMEGNPNAMIQLRQILRAREGFYAQADHVLDTSGKTVEESQRDLSQIIREHDLLSNREQSQNGGAQ